MNNIKYFNINDYQNVFEYNDPYPDAKANDIITRVCHKCNGSGVYSAPTSYYRDNKAYCFQCNGNGHYDVKVSSVRNAVKNKVKNNIKKRDYDIKREELRIKREKEYAEKKAQWELKERINESIIFNIEAENPIGSSIEEEVVISNIKEYMQQPYGYYDEPKEAYIVAFGSEVNNYNYVWFTTSKKVNDMSIGDSIHISAVVKKYNVFNDTIQCIISKVKVS